MNTLVSVGVMAAYLHSAVAVLVPSAFAHGDHARPHLYFEAAVAIVVFVLIGWSAVLAGFSENPADVHTTETSLRTLASQPGDWGRVLLGTTAAGFVAYGFYQMVHARYLHIRIPQIV